MADESPATSPNPRDAPALPFVTLTSAGDGKTSYIYSFGDLPNLQADKAFAADCGIARIRSGLGELHFAQINPWSPDSVKRSIIVRFDPQMFRARPNGNEKFRTETENKLSKFNIREEIGAFTRLFSSLKHEGSDFSVVDAEIELMSTGGSRGMIILFRPFSHFDRHNAIASKEESRKYLITPFLVVEMSSPALLDLLLSWKQVAEGK